MDEDELLDEDDLVDGASEGSDDAARMGIQSMQVSRALHTSSNSAAANAALPLAFVCFVGCLLHTIVHIERMHASIYLVHRVDLCCCVAKVHEVELAGDGGSDGGLGAMPTPAQAAAAGGAAAAGEAVPAAEAANAQAAPAQPAAARPSTAAPATAQQPAGSQSARR